MDFVLIGVIIIITGWIISKFGGESKARLESKKTIQKSATVRINGIQFGDHTTATPKKLEELNRLTVWMDALVHDKGFTVRSDWSNGWPMEKKLHCDTTKGPFFVTGYIENSGQNYDKIGKIEINVYFDDRDTLLTLNAAMSRVDGIIVKERTNLEKLTTDNNITP